MMQMVPWDDGLKEMFRDPEFVAAYLQAAWEEDGTSGVALALRHIAEMGRKRPPDSPAPDTSLTTVYEALRTLGLELSVSPIA